MLLDVLLEREGFYHDALRIRAAAEEVLSRAAEGVSAYSVVTSSTEFFEEPEGVLAAPWVKTLPQFEKLHEEQVDQMASAKLQK